MKKTKNVNLLYAKIVQLNVFMKEIGTDCVDFLLDSNNISVKFLKDLGLRRSHFCKKNAINAYIIATKLLKKSINKI